MDLIFLDCDGVINSYSFFNEYIYTNGNDRRSREEFKKKYVNGQKYKAYVVPALAARLRAVCKATDAKIVWTSSWRTKFENPDGSFNTEEIRDLWTEKGLSFENFIGCTPCLQAHRHSFVPRFLEIEKWLNDNSSLSIRKIAVIDDDPDAWRLERPDARFFQTTSEDGLTVQIAEEIESWFLA